MLIQKKWLVGIFMVLSLCAITQAARSRFITDFEQAKTDAKASHKYILLSFMGSDWCLWCVKLIDEVFSEKEFKQYAEDSLICVELDFPKRKKLQHTLRQQNESLRAAYQVEGYPTVIILSPDGELVARTGYQPGGAAAYIAHVQGLIEPHRKANAIPEPASLVLSRTGGLPPGVALRPLPKDANREIRIWTSKKGHTLSASILQELGPYAVLQNAEGRTLKIVMAMLSDADRAYVLGLKQALALP